MASSGHTAAQRTAMQTEYTANKTAVTAAHSAGVASVEAYLNDRQKELQLVVTREQGAALS